MNCSTNTFRKFISEASPIAFSIRHNLIHDVDSNGIKLLYARNVTVWYNDVSRVGLDGTESDAAGLYVNVTAGGPTGSHVVYDLTHNGCPGHPAAAIYLDMDGVYNCTVSNNVIYNIEGKCGIHVRGAHHVIRNNIIDFAKPNRLAAFTLLVGYKAANVAVDKPPIHHHDYVFENNIVWSASGSIFKVRGQVDEKTFRRVDNNLYHNPASKYSFHNLTLEQWRKRGLDAHSRFADLRFVDQANHDYRLRPDSPALLLGFHQISIASAGLREGFLWSGNPRIPPKQGRWALGAGNCESRCVCSIWNTTR